jgi:hypothetical protein
MQRLINSHLTFADDAAESAFVQYVIAEVENCRQLMGVQTTSRDYTVGSLLWRWDNYQLAYEQDFEHRKANCLLFRETNLSLNLPMTPVNQHGDKMDNDLLSTPAFFGPNAEGAEDENPAIEILMQRLKHRAKLTKLNEVGKKAKQGSLIRGQEITRAGLSEAYYMKPVVTQSVTLDGKVIKDSQGQPVLSTDKWISDPAYPDRQVLERDPAIFVPKGAALQISKPKVVMQRTSKEPGAETKVIHYGDFFCHINAENLDVSPLKGHVFAANPGDLLIGYAPETRETKAFDDYNDKAKTGNLTGGADTATYTVRANLNRVRDGENEASMRPATEDPKRFRTRVYVETWIRYDADGDGYAEPIYVLIDWDAKIPIHYEYASIILPWSDKEAPHPYTDHRIWPKLHRWTGRGYYELLDTWHEVSDKMLNRIEFDANTSGNVLFENPLATQQGIDGGGIQFRNSEGYQLRAGFTADDAMAVKTVAPANVEIFSTLMDRFIGRAEINAGLTSPADSTVADVPGQDTLGVAKILENTSNQSLRARENEVVEGLTAMLNDFIDIELYTMTNTEAGLAALIKQVGEEKAMVLIEWVKGFPEDVRNVFEISLTKSHSSQMVEVGQAIINVLNQFAVMAPPMQQAMMRQYTDILKGIGEPNPETTLAAIQQATAIMAQAQAEAMAAEAEAGQPPQEPPTR